MTSAPSYSSVGPVTQAPGSCPAGPAGTEGLPGTDGMDGTPGYVTIKKLFLNMND